MANLDTDVQLGQVLVRRIGMLGIRAVDLVEALLQPCYSLAGVSTSSSTDYNRQQARSAAADMLQLSMPQLRTRLRRHLKAWVVSTEQQFLDICHACKDVADGKIMWQTRVYALIHHNKLCCVPLQYLKLWRTLFFWPLRIQIPHLGLNKWYHQQWWVKQLVY